MENKGKEIEGTQSNSLSSSTSSLSEIPEENILDTSTDSKALQSILPEEVWIIIAEKVIKNQNELFQNFGYLSNSSPYFRKLLESKRVLYLFEWTFLIAHPWILATTKDDKGSHSSSDSENSWETVDEDSDVDSIENMSAELPDQKPISAIKTCRAVCSTWNLSIDQILFEQVISPTKKGLHSLERRVLEKMQCQTFENTQEVNKFLNFFKCTHPIGIRNRSPFVSKEVKIHLSCDDAYMERDPGFPKAVKNLLEAYADHIWSFAVYVHGHNVYIGDHTKYIKKALKFVKMFPRVKRLVVADNASNFFGSLDEAIIEDDGLQIENNPQYQLPHFPDLLELTTSGLAVPIFQHLMQNNNHVNTLKVNRNPEGNYNFFNLPFLNLQILHLNFWSMAQVAMLDNLEYPWSLKQLQFSYSNGPEFPDYSRIFDIIGTNWRNTLTYLNIHLPQAQNAEDYVKVLEQTGNERLFLPRLETFKLTIYQQFFLDFMLPTANSLKSLSVTQINNPIYFDIPTISKRDKKKEVIKFVAMEGQLRNSNIWKLFPNLVYIYTIGCKKVGGLIEEISR